MKSFFNWFSSAAANVRHYLSTQIRQKFLIRETMKLLIVSILYFLVDMTVLEKFVRILQIVERFL